MANAKGSKIVALRAILKKNKKESQILAKLTEEEINLYQKTLAINWVDHNKTLNLFLKIASILYPNFDPIEGNCLLERQMAEHHFSGFYNILLKVISIPNLIKQVAKIWRQYNDTGDLIALPQANKCVLLRLTKFPTISKAFYVGLSGYYKKMIELTGVKDIKIIPTKTPDGCDWLITWK